VSREEAFEPDCETGALPEVIDVVVRGRPAPIGSLGVTRLLPERRRRNVGPFVFLDHMGPVTLAPGEGFDVRPHPHIGLSTVTYLFHGEIVHRDSLGNTQSIRPDELNLMSAGRAITHSERSPADARQAGAALHGLQLWLALPLAAEAGEPGFQHHSAASLPRFERDGVRGRVVLGEYRGLRSPARDPSAPLLIDLDIESGASFTLDLATAECALYVVGGEVEVEGCRFPRHHLLVQKAGAMLTVTAVTGARAVVLGGPALDAPRYIDWNFVASSRERIEHAKAAWRAQTFPKIPGDDREFIPLPG
jgi:redox-sensitive bicupin YhaK (pirin superfamily)